jgi:DNA polymerase-1
MKQIYLVDASIYIFRAYFSIPEDLTDRRGNPANAVYGFAHFLGGLLDRTRARHIAVAFDESLTTSFRNEIYPPYKSNRVLPPPELEAQLAACQELAQVLGLNTLVSSRYEADDLIGTVANTVRRADFAAVIVSGDKDLTQLIGPHDIWWDYTRDRQFDAAAIKAHFGVNPQQIVDLIALTGDAVDNIPGIAGVGPRTAVQLLQHFGSLDAIYERLDEIPALPLRSAKRIHALLRDGKDSAYLSQLLAQIAVDAPIKYSPRSLTRKPIDQAQLKKLCKRLNLGEKLRTKLQGPSSK